MANYRQIHTKIWKDSWFLELSAAAKLLFIYLFGNERASVSGLYDLSVKVIAFETELDAAFVHHTLDAFQEAGKIMFDGSLIWVHNLRLYNASSSIKVLECIRRDLNAIPDCPIKRAYIQEWGIPPEREKPPLKPPIPPKRTGRPPGSRGSQVSVRKRLIIERGEQCEFCGAGKPVELHHRKPARAGGTLDDDNCILLCVPCHQTADAGNRKIYPILPTRIPYPQTENEQEKEQEQEHDHEQDSTPTASPPTPPTDFAGWQALLQESQNRSATLKFLYETLFPGRSPPDYGYLGKAARKVGGAGRLADLMWQCSSRPPTGDILAYCMATAKGKQQKGGNDPLGDYHRLAKKEGWE